MTPRDDGDREPLSIAPSREGVARLFAIQAERAGARIGSLAVAREGDDGTVAGTARETLRRRLGRASRSTPTATSTPACSGAGRWATSTEQSIREIWTGSAGLREVRELTAEAKGVVDAHGPAGPLLNFCPGPADTRTGDPAAGLPRRRDAAPERRTLLDREVPWTQEKKDSRDTAARSSILAPSSGPTTRSVPGGRTPGLPLAGGDGAQTAAMASSGSR